MFLRARGQPPTRHPHFVLLPAVTRYTRAGASHGYLPRFFIASMKPAGNSKAPGVNVVCTAVMNDSVTVDREMVASGEMVASASQLAAQKASLATPGSRSPSSPPMFVKFLTGRHNRKSLSKRDVQLPIDFANVGVSERVRPSPT